MRSKYLLMSLAIPALFAACADDEFATSAQWGEAVNGQMIELGEDFAVGLTRGEAVDTRTAWYYKGQGGIQYSWLPSFDGTTVTEENIGFAWRGETPDSKVRTNYKFTLDGFLKKGETKAKTIVCNGEVMVLNGYTFPRNNEGKIVATATNGESTMDLLEYKDANKSMVSSVTYDLKYSLGGGHTLTGAKATTIEAGLLDPSKLNDADPYVRNGIFTTDNSTIFKGDYIVYFPYNPTFAEVDYLPAVSPTVFTQDDANPNRVAHLAGKTFGYGKATIENGGSMAESFATYNLSSIVNFKVKNASGDIRRIQKIIFVDEAEGAKGFVKQVGLDATKIGTATGANLYVAGTEVYEPTLVLNLINSAKGVESEKIESYLDKGVTKEYTLAALPTKLGKPVAYLMNEKGLCLRKELAVKDLPAGNGVLFDIEIKESDKFNLLLAVDTKTFIERLSEAGRDVTDNVTVKVLGNITLDPEAEVTVGGNTAKLNAQFLQADKSGRSIFIGKNVVVDGIGTITIPADLNIVMKAANGKTLTIKNPVVIEGAGCCGFNRGQLILQSPTSGKGTFVFDGNVENYGEMWLANNIFDKDVTTKVVFNGSLLNGIDTETADEDNNAGIINCAGMKGSVIEMNGNVTNKGIINVRNQYKNITEKHTIFPEDITNSTDASAHFTPGGVQVTANANLVNEGEINVGRFTVLNTTAAVDNDGAINVNTAAANNQSMDGKWVMTGTGTNAGVIDNRGVINIINNGTIANDAAEAQVVDHVGCQFGGSFPKVEMGEYICDVDDENVSENGDRLGYAMGPVIPTTTIRFIGKGTTKGETAGSGYVYNLNGYKTDNVLDYNFIIEATSDVKLIGLGVVKVGNTLVEVAQPVTIAGKLTVNSKLDLANVMLTVNDVVTVNNELTVKPYGQSVNTREAEVAFTAQKDVNVTKGATFTVDKFVKTDLNGNLTVTGEGAGAHFNFATYTDVQSKITVGAKATFERMVATGGIDAIAAEVYCGSYDITGNVTDGYPVKR